MFKSFDQFSENLEKMNWKNTDSRLLKMISQCDHSDSSLY